MQKNCGVFNQFLQTQTRKLSGAFQPQKYAEQPISRSVDGKGTTWKKNTLQGTNIIPPGEKETHLQKWILMGYVSSQEGTPTKIANTCAKNLKIFYLLQHDVFEKKNSNFRTSYDFSSKQPFPPQHHSWPQIPFHLLEGKDPSLLK